MFTSARVAGCLLCLSLGPAWIGVRAAGTPAVAAAAPAILESSALRVEVTTSPCAFAVVEEATGRVLLRHAQTTFTVGTIGKRSATTLDATLTFAGASDTARVRWTFVDPAVLQVRLTYDDGTRGDVGADSPLRPREGETR